ncbi:MAG: ABC transporter permease [Elusimicrobia bacterium RIFCSPHIGHO2_02_FULL_57_9]|nr:MAG: ABC transporter permease [Elusimicrobia bacterium RIFCSPHIGHO2_02_FULL_57_9]
MSSVDTQTAKDWRTRLREFYGALQNVPRAFKLLWEADRFSAVGTGAIVLISSMLPVSQAWVTKLIIDGVLEQIRLNAEVQQGFRAVLPYLTIEFGLIFVGAINGQMRQLMDKFSSLKLGHLINTRIISKAISLEARWFEDPEFYDKMQNARRQSEWRAQGIVNAGFLLAQNLLSLFSFLAVLIAFSPSLALLLFAAGIPAFLVQCRYSSLSFRLETWRAPETRAMTYLEQLLTQDDSVKEIKLFGLGRPLLSRYTGMFWKIFSEDAELAKSRSFKALAWGLLSTLSYYVSYGWCIWLTISGRISLGQMTFYITMFSQSQGTFQGMLDNINTLYENGLFLDNLFGFFGLTSNIEVWDAAKRPADDPRRGIEFKNVWFRYPGNEEWALQDFSLEIGPAEKLALVGPNGSGKTTLVKLLTRLYEPVRGDIYLRGVNIKYLPPEEIHRRIGAIFQDFVRYHLTFRENVGFGAVEHLDDMARIMAAVRKAGAEQIVEGLPKKYESVLGRWFDSGHELSGGQWQKVALGRAFMSGGEVLVLDEPTASLDAQAEFDIFQRFRDLTQGKIAILVSHRFSTVRMADLIAVLKGGRLEELGSHQELLARGGTYAQLFGLQAQGYR